jgi:signal peptidase I
MTPRARTRHRELTDFLAFALAVVFLARTFVGEPYGVPTNSMAPTLLGSHRLIRCLACGHEFPIAAAPEEPALDCRCPKCETKLDISGAPVKPGSRIMVLKGPPTPLKRWDVAVFKNVDEPQKLFVKRIVGLPGERIRIHEGEIDVWDRSSKSWRTATKPADLAWIRYTSSAEGMDSFSQTEFTIGPHQYVALGDNSPQSVDSRHWRHSPFIDERMIVGRVLFKLGR